MRQHGEHDEDVREHVHQHILDAARPFGLNGPHGAHCKALFVHIPFLHQEQHRCDDHHDGRHRRGKVGRAAGFADKLNIDFRRQNVKSFTD